MLWLFQGVSSFVGSLLATIGFMVLAPDLARVGPAGYFALYILTFSTLGGIGSKKSG